MATTGKNYRASPAFLPTPDETPEASACRTFLVPASDQWLGALMAVVGVLAEEWAWYEWGSVSPAASAEAWNVIINNAYKQAKTGSCSIDVPAPYWDEGADNEGREAAALDQGWYGVLTSEVWYEQLADWTLAGFLAIAATPAAALQYLTYVPRFRLALRTHDAGSAVKIFLDGTEIFAGDTYSASPGEMNVDVFADKLSPDVSPHVVMLVQDGASSLQVIRKKLDPAEVSPANQRYNSGGDSVQTTNDGGVTWVDTPASDPRHSPAFSLPPLTGTDVPCHAAANMRRFFEDFIGTTLTALTEGLDALALATTLISIVFGGFGLFIDLVIDLAAVLASAGDTAINAAFTPEVFDQLQCIFYCNVDSSGQVDAAALSNIEAQISSQIGGLVSVVMSACLFIMGEVGLSNSGVTTVNPSADCSGCDCGWCVELDLTVSDYGMVAVPGYTGCAWSAGIGAYNSGVYGYSKINFGATWNANTIEIEYATTGTINPGNLCIYDANSGSTTLIGCYDDTPPVQIYDDGGGTPFAFDEIRLNPTNQNLGGVYQIQKIRFKGSGSMAKPDFGTDCP